MLKCILTTSEIILYYMLEICTSKFYSNEYFLSCEAKFIFKCKEHANEAVEMLAYVI